MPDSTAPPPMHITQEELIKNKIPLIWRDYCAHLFVEMDKCMKSEGYWPWKCELPRHAWMKCQYDDYIRRMHILEKQKRQKSEDLKEQMKQEILSE